MDSDEGQTETYGIFRKIGRWFGRARDSDESANSGEDRALSQPEDDEKSSIIYWPLP